MAKSETPSIGRRPSDPAGPTGMLSQFLDDIVLDRVPDEAVVRAKHLILDGIGCGLLSARVPWSDLAVTTLADLEGEGIATVWGWSKRVPPTVAALLNGTFIQGFELDDYHQFGPLHSEACVIPAVFAAAEHVASVSGGRFLEAVIAGFEVGPRVGMALGGLDLVARGWHCGPIFGVIAAAAGAGKLYGLDPGGFEDAIGMAATQAAGLMSAQFEAMVKRMHSGMASRNGLMAAALAKRGFSGIKRVLEREYGGYARSFGGDSVKLDRLTDGLGERWELQRIAVKPPYACMGGLHAAIDAALTLRKDKQISAEDVEAIRVGVAHAMFEHGGWKLDRPAEVIGAQMNLGYAVSVALIDGAAFVPQFSPQRIQRDDVWSMMDKVTVDWEKDLDGLGEAARWVTRLHITLRTGRVEACEVRHPWGGLERPLTNEEIRDKFHRLAELVIDGERARRIEDLVLNIVECPDIAQLRDLLAAPCRPPF